MTPPTTNRSMFRRLIRRLLFANRGRLFVILLALSAGAAVSAALLNLQTDAKRRLTTDFRNFGANVIVTSRSSGSSSTDADTIPSSVLERIPTANKEVQVAKTGLLYLVMQTRALDDNLKPRPSTRPLSVVVVGYDSSSPFFDKMIPSRLLQESKTAFLDIEECQLGQSAASTLNLSLMQFLEFRSDKGSGYCSVSAIRSFGGPEDNQIFVPINYLQYQTGNMERLSTVLLNVSGNSHLVDEYANALGKRLSDADVRPLRQFSEAQAKIYSRISGLLTAATALILILTALCVMAAMTNIAAERKHDVGMMKAIGGSARGILNLFLTEAALLGLAGGLIGAAAGIALSIALGKAVFGIAAAPRLIVYPISVALTVIVAIVGAYPLRRLANVRPATIFRGDA